MNVTRVEHSRVLVAVYEGTNRCVAVCVCILDRLHRELESGLCDRDNEQAYKHSVTTLSRVYFLLALYYLWDAHRDRHPYKMVLLVQRPETGLPTEWNGITHEVPQKWKLVFACILLLLGGYGMILLRTFKSHWQLDRVRLLTYWYAGVSLALGTFALVAGYLSAVCVGLHLLSLVELRTPTDERISTPDYFTLGLHFWALVPVGVKLVRFGAPLKALADVLDFVRTVRRKRRIFGHTNMAVIITDAAETSDPAQPDYGASDHVP